MKTNPKILIAEDELVLQLMLNQMLLKMGFSDIVAVSKGSEVIDACDKTYFDLILMDIILMDEIDGIEAYGIIRRDKEIPVIYITGNTDQRNRERAEKLGFIDYLAKPVTYYQLSNAIMSVFKK